MRRLKSLQVRIVALFLNLERSRFNNGEGKIKIKDTVRDKEIYILCDVGNYDITYEMHGFTHHMGPDEHFQDIKRTISALSGYASKIVLVTPLLYQSRQHKRKGRESLDCAMALQELDRLELNILLLLMLMILVFVMLFLIYLLKIFIQLIRYLKILLMKTIQLIH